MSTLTDIADAVVSDLNGHTFSLAFAAERKWLAELKLADMSDTVHVTVVPGVVTQKPLTRAKREGDYQVQIGVRRRPAGVTSTTGDILNAPIDPLSDLVEEIDDFLAAQSRLAADATFVWAGSELTLPFSPEHLDGWNQFTSVLTVTFRKWRNL
jgi:hypothetical protein